MIIDNETISMRKQLSLTKSICPECLQQIPAKVVAMGDTVFLEKICPGHGSWRVPLWRGAPAYEEWQRPKARCRRNAAVKEGCPYDCGLCPEHRQYPRSVLLEVTQRCTLGCPVCFADAGMTRKEVSDPDMATIAGWYDRIMAAAGPCNIQLSGGEPTLRQDLPEIIALGRRKGFFLIQLNTNGLQLAREPDLAKTLAKAGLLTVFLQFDGMDDHIHSVLRGRPLLREKIDAIQRCGEAGLGVVLVPTLVPGVNTGEIGAIIRLALERSPVVRGVHFQTVGYFGRYLLRKSSFERFTLPEVMRAIEKQTDGLMRETDFLPPEGENARCSFQGSFSLLPDGRLRRPTPAAAPCWGVLDGHEALYRTVGTVARQWWPAPSARAVAKGPAGADMDWAPAISHSLSISCSAFQDARNIDLERLRGCCVSVMSPDGRLVPFCAYNLTSNRGAALYRHRKEPWHKKTPIKT